MPPLWVPGRPLLRPGGRVSLPLIPAVLLLVPPGMSLRTNDGPYVVPRIVFIVYKDLSEIGRRASSPFEVGEKRVSLVTFPGELGS